MFLEKLGVVRKLFLLQVFDKSFKNTVETNLKPDLSFHGCGFVFEEVIFDGFLESPTKACTNNSSTHVELSVVPSEDDNRLRLANSQTLVWKRCCGVANWSKECGCTRLCVHLQARLAMIVLAAAIAFSTTRALFQ